MMKKYNNHKESFNQITIKRMKTLRFIGVALLAVLMSVSFSACGGDDDDNSSNPLVGTWVGLAGESGWTSNHKIIFNSNGTGSWNQWSDKSSFTDPFNYTCTETVITIDFGDGSAEQWRYSISGNVLNMGKGEKMFKLTKQ